MTAAVIFSPHPEMSGKPCGGFLKSSSILEEKQLFECFGRLVQKWDVFSSTLYFADLLGKTGVDKSLVSGSNEQ